MLSACVVRGRSAAMEFCYRLDTLRNYLIPQGIAKFWKTMFKKRNFFSFYYSIFLFDMRL